MEIFRTVPDLIFYLKEYKKVASSIGLVPTMGALHAGHLSLIDRAKRENDLVVSTIFVNPLQFNNNQDLQLYPRPVEQDISLLNRSGCTALFLPSIEQMYPDEPKISLDFGFLEKVLEGKFRPGHFSGVGLVVSKFFNLIRPDRAYFGKKDLQQLAVVKQLTRDFSFPVKIIPCETLREPDGLAMSSRNRRLSQEHRSIAAKLYECLCDATLKISKESPLTIKKQAAEFLNVFPQIQLEYFEIVDSETFLEVIDVKMHKQIAFCIAAFLDNVRLIDNVVIDYPYTALK